MICKEGMMCDIDLGQDVAHVLFVLLLRWGWVDLLLSEGTKVQLEWQGPQSM